MSSRVRLFSERREAVDDDRHPMTGHDLHEGRALTRKGDDDLPHGVVNNLIGHGHGAHYLVLGVRDGAR